MGGYLFFGAVVVHWAWDFFGVDTADSIPREFDRHVVRHVIDAAGRGNGSSMALFIMARKVVLLLSLQTKKVFELRSAFINRA